MTPRERDHVIAYRLYLRKVARQQEQQTGGSPKWNCAVDDGGAEIIVMLEHVDEGDQSP
jgi:hypothetical protein